jgi:DNA-binding transcriptional ArsR family regulator
MVERTIEIDAVFYSLGDRTRRDILRRVAKVPQSIGVLADAHPSMTFAAVAKHVSVLEEAKLVMKKREGKYQIISLNPKALSAARQVLESYQDLWEKRFTQLDELLK